MARGLTAYPGYLRQQRRGDLFAAAGLLAVIVALLAMLTATGRL